MLTRWYLTCLTSENCNARIGPTSGKRRRRSILIGWDSEQGWGSFTMLGHVLRRASPPQLNWLPAIPSWDERLKQLHESDDASWGELIALANGGLELLETISLDRKLTRLFPQPPPPRLQRNRCAWPFWLHQPSSTSNLESAWELCGIEFGSTSIRHRMANILVSYSIRIQDCIDTNPIVYYLR